MTLTPGSLSARTADRCDALLAELTDDAAIRRVAEVRAGLDDQLRIAVAGRLKAGKSTLVNAILHQRIAPTDVGECTRVVTVFRYGYPERVVVHPRDGEPREQPLSVDIGLPETLGLPPEDVRRVEVQLSNQALADIVLVDTPGLASATETTSATAREYLAIDGASRDAVSGVEALVYVLSKSPREDDRAALTAFRELSAQTGASAATCVAVLGRADEITSGPAASVVDPLAAALSLADQHQEALAGLVDCVVPVSGLWAQTAVTGALTEFDALALDRLAGWPGSRQLLLSAGRFVADDADAPVDVAGRRRLLDLLGLTGLRVALALVDGRCTGAGALCRELARLSGIDRLSVAVDSLRSRSDVLKAQWAIAQLERVHAYDAPSRAVRDAAEELRLDPAMQRLNDVRALQLVAGGVQLPEPMAREVVRMATANDPAERLGLAHGAPADLLQTRAAEAAVRWHAFAADSPRTTPDQEQVARLMYRSYTHLRMQLTGAFL
jgi:hypothetical protein